VKTEVKAEAVGDGYRWKSSNTEGIRVSNETSVAGVAGDFVFHNSHLVLLVSLIKQVSLVSLVHNLAGTVLFTTQFR